MGAPISDLLAGIAASCPRYVERPDASNWRGVAHRDIGDASREKGRVYPVLDIVSGPVNGVDHDVIALDRRGDLGLAFKSLRQHPKPHPRVEGRESLRSGLRLRLADVGLAVEDLSVQVGQLDPAEVDQQHLTDPTAGES